MQPHRDRPTSTVAILGADTVVGSALCALLEGSGYRIIPLDSHPTGVVDELLEGADLLLLAPRLDEGAREAFLGAMGKSVPQHAAMPVIALTTAVEEAPTEGAIQTVPWPRETKALVQSIEAALIDAPAPSAARPIPESAGGSDTASRAR